MDVSKVFCNIPWFEVHINADGTYHSCGAQPNRITGTDQAKTNNVLNMTIPEWINSQHQRRARTSKLNGIAEPLCNICYNEDELGSSSKRVKENHKSGINVVNFYETYKASPHNKIFDACLETGYTDVQPNSFHISLGNECNLACKMCVPWASSKIASQQKVLGLWDGPVRLNWTEDEAAWNHVVEYLCNLDSLQYLHIIGGEPLLNPRFKQLVEHLVDAGKTDIYLGFTTNGTIVDLELIEKLNVFRHVDIGISIEAAGELNSFIRQGSKTQSVLDNVDIYLKHRSESHVYVTLRIVPSALSVHTLDELFKWCIDRQLDVMSNFLVSPPFLQIQNLPIDVKHRLLTQYRHWKHGPELVGTPNPRDPNYYRQHIDAEVNAIITALEKPNDPHYTKELYEKLALWHWLGHEEIAKYFETIAQG